VLADPAARIPEGEPGSRTALLVAEAAVALVEGDRATALAKSVASIEAESGSRGSSNAMAAQVWWTARLFGDDAAGGPEPVREARERLEHNGWRQALREPELASDLG
jgi:hypothetical protein